MSRSFSKPSIELAARLGCGLIVAPFAAAMTFGGLKEVADLYHETCAKHGQKPGRLMCSYFTHFADDPAAGGGGAGAADQVLQGMRHPRLPRRPDKRAAELPLFHRHGRAAEQRAARGSDRQRRAAGLGRAHDETLKRVQAAGFSEVILYFNVGLKPHQQVKDEMARFMEEVAPQFR